MNVIGYDLNDQFCQISYYHDGMEEPQTKEVLADNYKIPLVLGTYRGHWIYGREAVRHSLGEGRCNFADCLLSRAVKGETVMIAKREFDARQLLLKYIRLSLSSYEEIGFIVFSVPVLSEDLVHLLKTIGEKLGIDRNHTIVQDYKESFCHFMFDQPKELWQYEAALFYCDKEQVSAYMMKRIDTGYSRDGTAFVMVEKVSHALMSELHVTFPVMNVDSAMEADLRFMSFVNGVFAKRRVSSVFLTGEGFETSWYPETLKVMCNGRRCFIGNNLYSKGACYEALRKVTGRTDGPIYLDESKMTDRICMKIRRDGVEEWYPIVSWGEHWYESDCTYEILLENNDPIELYQNSLATGEEKTIMVPLDGLPNRKNYTLRLRVQATFTNENRCRITFTDTGFGEIFPETDFSTEVTVVLGGSNEQFNTLS